MKTDDRGVKETSLSSVNNHQWTVLWYLWHQLAATIAQSCDSFQSNWTSLYTLTHVTLLTDTMTAYVTDSQHYPPRWQPHLGLKTWDCPSAARTEEEVKHLFESEKEEESSTQDHRDLDDWEPARISGHAAKESCHPLSLCSGQGFSLYVEQNTFTLTDLSLIMNGDV